ncbi:MAG: hypothetical protein PVG39_26595, partial [Desulfobacteraceae bacterium]
MVNIKNIMAFARTEIRLTRRLVRYWFFISISYLIAFIYFLIYSVLHGVYSSYSATEALLSPRYIISTIGLDCLSMYIGGAVFLGFDVRSRDQREQITEVLDSRPYTNSELVTGRFMGLLISLWIPIMALALILQFLGLLLPLPFGDTIEIYSLFAFVFLMAIPALAFTISLVFLMTLLTRNRFVAALLLLLILGGDFWGISNLPSIYSPLLDLSGSTIINNPSEIIPSMINLTGLLQRTGVLLMAFGMLGFSAVAHPRLDGDSRKKLTACGAGIIIMTLVMTGFGFYQNINTINITDEWKRAHAVNVGTPVPDLRKISGDVKIDPGKALILDLELTIRAPDKEPLKIAIFTLNPGQKVTGVLDIFNNPLSFTHESGLLELILPRPLDPGEETIIHLSIEGLPDKRFGYLESAVNTENLKSGQKNLSMLGLDRYVYDPRFVALMPGIRWLPVPGTEKDCDDPRHRSVDFFTLDLTVDLPSAWLVAGPGRRYESKCGEANRVKYRFSPSAPLPEVAIIASKFESRSFEVEGVKMEILIHPEHIKNIELLSDSGEKIRTWIGDHMREAKEYGLEYPYDSLTLVEVPNTQRGYTGGWRMDTAMAPPGLLLMHENSFPTARFDWPFRNPKDFKDLDGGITQAKLTSLQTFFINDISGGNIFSGAARNFFLYQTSARGPEAIVLNYVMEILSTLLVAETNTYFSAHDFTEEDPLGAVFGALVISRDSESSSKRSMTEAAIAMTSSGQEVWNQALKVSLKDMDPWDDPARKINVLVLKAGSMARCILDILGREKTAQLLSSIRKSHKGGTFSFDDMKDQGRALGVNFEELFGDWLGSTSLPGFICSKAEVYRLPDSENGMPRYQLLITVRNDEPVPGAFRFQYRVGDGEKHEWSKSDPIRIDGKQTIRFGMVLFQPPVNILIEPYISLNRGPFTISLQRVDQDKIINVDAIEGMENLPWSPPESNFIEVDNLDKGFEVLEGEKKKDVPKGRQMASIAFNGKSLSTWASYVPPPEWTYLDLPGSWGKYRHTTAAIKAGEGENKATFTTVIKKSGSWNLWLHMPSKQKSFPGLEFGTWSLIVKDTNGDSHEIKFNSDAALEGWNHADTLELPEGIVSVTFSDKTDKGPVLADAIRWSPSAGE